MKNKGSRMKEQMFSPAPLLPRSLAPLLPTPLIAGIDEVGRGCLFGPVVAAAVILSDEAISKLGKAGIKDSKQLSSNRRKFFAEEIRMRSIAYQIGIASVWEIDRLNIFQASLLAMKRSVMRLKVQPTLCLVDGKWPIPELAIPQESVVKGDEKFVAIAAASILAKVWRDALISRLAVKYPEYNLEANKGYGTAKHILALEKYGPSRWHRLSFRPCREALGGVGEQRSSGK